MECDQEVLEYEEWGIGEDGDALAMDWKLVITFVYERIQVLTTQKVTISRYFNKFKTCTQMIGMTCQWMPMINGYD